MLNLIQTNVRQISLDDTIGKLEQASQGLMNEFLAKNETLSQFHSGQWIDQRFYIRHIAEAANRIPLLNRADSYALYMWGTVKPELGRDLAKYLAEEWGHEQMIFPDLKQFGISPEECQKISLFEATKLLINHHYKESEKGLIFSAVFNWFVEWYSDHYNPIITKKASESLGIHTTKGMNAHLTYDTKHDHESLMRSILRESITTFGSFDYALCCLHDTAGFVENYFIELYNNYGI